MAIKSQYDAVCHEFGIQSKVFKIVADSAANNRNAFKKELEANDESHILAKLILKQKKRDLFLEKQEKLRKILSRAVMTINQLIIKFKAIKSIKYFNF